MVVLVVVPVRQATIKQGFKKGSPRKRFWPQDWESFENCILPSGSFFRKMIMVEPLLQVVWYIRDGSRKSENTSKWFHGKR